MRKKALVGMLLLALGFLFVAGGGVTAAASVAERLLERLKTDVKPVEPLMPPDVKVQPGFQPGVGPVVGNIQMVQGEVLVFHKDQKVAYAIQKDHPLFIGDTLVCGERSRANAKLNDRSVFSLASHSKLTIDQSIFDAQKETRSSALSLLFGRARFIVAKLSGASNYQIKTPTAVCGVRGSDLGLMVAPAETNTSFVPRMLAFFNPVKSAHAQGPAPLVTILVTGADTSVGFTGVVGASQAVGPFAVTSAAAGASAMAPITVGATAAMGALGSMGPGLAAMTMPPTM